MIVLASPHCLPFQCVLVVPNIFGFKCTFCGGHKNFNLINTFTIKTSLLVYVNYTIYILRLFLLFIFTKVDISDINKLPRSLSVSVVTFLI